MHTCLHTRSFRHITHAWSRHTWPSTPLLPCENRRCARHCRVVRSREDSDSDSDSGRCSGRLVLHLCVYMWMRLCVRVWMHLCVCMWVHWSACMWIQVCFVHIHIIHSLQCMHTCTHAIMHAPGRVRQHSLALWSIHMLHTHTHTHMHAHTHTHKCTHLWTLAYTYIKIQTRVVQRLAALRCTMRLQEDMYTPFKSCYVHVLLLTRCVHEYIWICVCLSFCTFIHMCTYVCVCARTFMYVCICICVYISRKLLAWVLLMFTNMDMHQARICISHLHIPELGRRLDSSTHGSSTRTCCSCRRVDTQRRRHECPRQVWWDTPLRLHAVCMCVHVYVCMCVNLCACMCVGCAYAYLYTHICMHITYMRFLKRLCLRHAQTSGLG